MILDRNFFSSIYDPFEQFKNCLFTTFPLSNPINQPAPKDAGFHVVQALLRLTRHLPLKEALVLLTTIPKGILIFFYTQFI